MAALVIATVALLGKDYDVKLPPQFAVKEDLVVAWGESEGNTSRRQRVCGAILGVCCPDLGREAGADYVKARFDPLAYGGAVYGYLRQKGASMGDVTTAAIPIVNRLYEQVFPRKEEVDKKVVFSEPATGE